MTPNKTELYDLLSRAITARGFRGYEHVDLLSRLEWTTLDDLIALVEHEELLLNEKIKAASAKEVSDETPDLPAEASPAAREGIRKKRQAARAREKQRRCSEVDAALCRCLADLLGKGGIVRTILEARYASR